MGKLCDFHRALCCQHFCWKLPKLSPGSLAGIQEECMSITFSAAQKRALRTGRASWQNYEQHGKGYKGLGNGTHPGSSRRVSSWPDGWTSSLEPGYKSLHTGKSCCTNFCVPGLWKHRLQPANQDREHIITNWCRLPANEAPFYTQWASGPDNGPRLQGQSGGGGGGG